MTSDLNQPGLVRRFFERMSPDEGWASLPLVFLMAGFMAWSIADARWILGRDELTRFLIWIGLAAVFWGYLSSRLRIAPWLAHTLGCAIGAFVVIEAVGASLPGATPDLFGWFGATAHSVTEAYLDLTWRHQVSTLQVGHFCLVLGIVVWGTAQAAAYDVFGHHRAVNGVLLLGVVMVANMALTESDQFLGLVAFSAAALALLALAHAADERSAWLRHRIWRGHEFQAPRPRGGMAFTSVAVAGALILTVVASSAPLAGPFKDLGAQFADAMSWMSGYLPNGGSSRFQADSDFGPTAPISSSFNVSPHQVFTVRVDSSTSIPHWRLVAYDGFRTTGWSVGSDSHEDQVIAGGSLSGGTQDLVGPDAARAGAVAVVHVQDTSLKHLVVPNEPDSVNVGVGRTLVGTGAYSLNVAAFTTSATDYTVKARVPDLDPNGAGLTQWLLRHAGTDYPSGIFARYTQGEALVGSNGKSLLAEIETWARANGNPFDTGYDVAIAVQNYLRGSQFTYNTDISGAMPRCEGLSTVDCFALIREGFCEHYATTMTMLMRAEGYPARYVLGYLSGQVDPVTHLEQVSSSQKHAWVEVYFPNYGWIPFDPTGGGVGRPTELVPGSAPTPAPSAAPDSSATASAGPQASSTPAASPSAGVTAASGTDWNPLPVPLPIVVVPVTISVGLLLVFLLRRPRRLDEADTVYRRVVGLASRLGYRPRPTQTVYEYTGMLARVVPKARDSLDVVATAAVEVTYGKRHLEPEELDSLATAHGLIRRALLRLAFHWPKLRRRGRSGGGGSSGIGGSGERPGGRS